MPDFKIIREVNGEQVGRIEIELTLSIYFREGGA